MKRIILFLFAAFLICILSASVSFGQSVTHPDNPNGHTLTEYYGGVYVDGYFKPPLSYSCPIGKDSAGLYWYEASYRTYRFHNGTVKDRLINGRWFDSVYATLGGGVSQTTLNDSCASIRATIPASSGTVTSITAGTGLSGGTITTSGTISMPATGSAGTYGSATQVPVLTTDAQGRVTAVTNTSITYPATDSSIFSTRYRNDTGNTAIRAQLAALPIVDSSTYQTKFRSDTGRTNVYNYIVSSQLLDLKYTDSAAMLVPYIRKSDSGLYQTKYRSDTGRTNIYAYAASKISQNQLITETATGDASWTTSGTTTLTPSVVLATVNSNTGNWGSATQTPTFTVNGKGLVTAAGNVAITGFISSTLTDGKINIGNGSNVATAVTPSGDWTISNTGTATLKTSGALAGSWTTTTQSAADNSTKIATTAYVDRLSPADTTISAAYTLTVLDKNRSIHCTNSSNIALTIPVSLGTTFRCEVIQEGAGTVTPTASSTTLTFIPTGTTKTRQVGSAMIIRSWATANSFTVQGDLQ